MAEHDERPTPFQLFITQMPEKWEAEVLAILKRLNSDDLSSRAIQIASKKKYFPILEGIPENRARLSIELRNDPGWLQLRKDIVKIKNEVIEDTKQVRETQFLMAADVLTALRTRESAENISFRASFTAKELDEKLKDDVINGRTVDDFIIGILAQMALGIETATVKAFMGASSNPSEVFEFIRRDVSKVVETAQFRIKATIDDFIFMAVRSLNVDFADAEIQRV